MTAMKRTFRDRVLPWWYWRRLANRRDRLAFDADAQALFSRFTTPPTADDKELINVRILAAKASGAWDVYDGFGMVTADAQATQRNWKQDAYNLTPTGTIAFEAYRGYTGDGTTGYLATGFTPSTAGGQFALNSAHLSVWSRTDAVNTGVSIGARTSSTVGQSFMTIRGTANGCNHRMNQAAVGAATVVANSSGHFVARRNGATTRAFFRNGASVATDTTVSTTLPTAAIVIGALNTGGVIGSFTTYQYAAWSFGGNLTDAQILSEYQANLAYLQAIGAA